MNYEDFVIKPDAWSSRVVRHEFIELIETNEILNDLFKKTDISVEEYTSGVNEILELRSTYVASKIEDNFQFHDMYSELRRFTFTHPEKLKKSLFHSLQFDLDAVLLKLQNRVRSKYEKPYTFVSKE